MRTEGLIRAAILTISCLIALALLSIVVLTETGLACDGKGAGMANPASVYCDELGYEYKIVETEQGQYGICVFPDGSECDEWRFLAGECGQSYSYCARQGYDLTTKTDGNNPFSMRYAVCLHNQKEVGPVTQLMGLREKAIRGTFQVEGSSSRPEEGTSVQASPSSFDWRDYSGQNWMTRVKNQGECGSCWAFSAVGVVEAMYNIRKNNPNLDLYLSEEYLVSDCHTDPSYDQNCRGGRHNLALEYIRDSGIPKEDCMPYADSTCDMACSPAKCAYRDVNECSNRRCSDRCSDWLNRLSKISEMGPVPGDQATIKQYVVAKGPLAAAMNISGSFGGDGIYTCASADLEHAVVIAGYNDAGSYWIVKNSWGGNWPLPPDPRDGGYFKVGYGECGIEQDVYYGDPGPAVGGMGRYPDVAQSGVESAASGADGSSSPAHHYTPLAGGVAAAVVAATAGAWYARRRWLR